METCRACGKPVYKVLYKIFPMYLCSDTVKCAHLYGFWSFVVMVLPFNGIFVKYTDYVSGVKVYWRTLVKSV